MAGNDGMATAHDFAVPSERGGRCGGYYGLFFNKGMI